MSYLALYRKYRPKELDEVVGQNEVKKILASSVQNNTISHAYLFSGPRGTGKTTMAKILAKMVNCESPVNGNACGECDSCRNILNSNDVIEIDAASNNGVDEIRDLREKANLVPTNSKYKVYIIDEVHMLTTQAFNALLKTLEEPPKHVIFVLATTEYYKIPLTITSRCQKFQFNKITNENIVDRLKIIAEAENIMIDDDALCEIAKISDGGMRDSINFLDQLRSFSKEKITIKDVYNVCGSVSIQEIVDLFVDMRNDDVENVTIFFEKMDESGKNYGKFLEDVVTFLKDVVLYKKSVSDKYIRFDLDKIKLVGDLYSLNEIFEIVDGINILMDRLKNVSRQSVVVISNFLLMMNKINAVNEIIPIKKEKIDKKNDENLQYESAFQLTSNDDVSKDELTVNNSNKNIEIKNENNEVLLKNKDILINNTFALANKDLKNSLQKLMGNLPEFLTDKKFSNAASVLIDTRVEVAGKGYIILSGKSEAIIDKILDNYRICQELLNKLFNDSYNFVAITSDEWNKYRDKYINDIKNGVKYEIKPLENVDIQEEIKVKEPTIVDKLFDLVGEDSVEFK